MRSRTSGADAGGLRRPPSTSAGFRPAVRNACSIAPRARSSSPVSETRCDASASRSRPPDLPRRPARSPSTRSKTPSPARANTRSRTSSRGIPSDSGSARWWSPEPRQHLARQPVEHRGRDEHVARPRGDARPLRAASTSAGDVGRLHAGAAHQRAHRQARRAALVDHRRDRPRSRGRSLGVAARGRAARTARARPASGWRRAPGAGRAPAPPAMVTGGE